MHTLTRSYNRRYYFGLIKIELRKYWKLFKLELIHFLFWLSYKIDEEIAKRITGRDYR